MTAPSEYEPYSSKTGVNVLPRLSVFQRLPAAAATYQTLGFFGSIATSWMRPVVSPGPIERNAKSLNVLARHAIRLAVQDDRGGDAADSSTSRQRSQRGRSFS